MTSPARSSRLSLNSQPNYILFLTCENWKTWQSTFRAAKQFLRWCRKIYSSKNDFDKKILKHVLPGGMVSTFPWLKLTTELSNSEMDLIISTTFTWPRSLTTLKPSDTELLLWLRRNDPQMRLKVEALEDDTDEDVKVLADLWSVECLRFFLAAILLWPSRLQLPGVMIDPWAIRRDL